MGKFLEAGRNIIRFKQVVYFASASSKGSTPKESALLAEMYIFKQLFPGIQYDSKFESKLEMLFNPEEITSDPTKSGKIEMYAAKNPTGLGHPNRKRLLQRILMHVAVSLNVSGLATKKKTSVE
jgi:hypothetical protein